MGGPPSKKIEVSQWELTKSIQRNKMQLINFCRESHANPPLDPYSPHSKIFIARELDINATRQVRVLRKTKKILGVTVGDESRPWASLARLSVFQRCAWLYFSLSNIQQEILSDKTWRINNKTHTDQASSGGGVQVLNNLGTSLDKTRSQLSIY